VTGFEQAASFCIFNHREGNTILDAAPRICGFDLDADRRAETSGV
jgi:hypothetical protein